MTGAAARTAFYGSSLWAGADGAIQAIIPTLALELAPLRVNAVSPGTTDTEWWKQVPVEKRKGIFQEIAQKLPASRIGTADDVGHAIRFLAENSYVTGTVLDVDGGARLKK